MKPQKISVSQIGMLQYVKYILHNSLMKEYSYSCRYGVKMVSSSIITSPHKRRYVKVKYNFSEKCNLWNSSITTHTHRTGQKLKAWILVMHHKAPSLTYVTTVPTVVTFTVRLPLTIVQSMVTGTAEIEIGAVVICAYHYCRLYSAAGMVAHLYQPQYPYYVILFNRSQFP
jgi:hypothetical protein